MNEFVIYLNRDILSDACVQGLITCGDFEGCTLEPNPEMPFHENKPCIPEGRYPVKIVFSPKFQREVIRLDDVPGRSDIEVHGGNTAKDTKGCILPGMSRVPDMVMRSWVAVDAMLTVLKMHMGRGENCYIEIKDKYNG